MTWNHRPPCNYSSEASLTSIPNANTGWWMSIKRCAKALAEGKTEISWYIGGDRQGIATISTRRAQQEPMLMLMGFKNTPRSDCGPRATGSQTAVDL